MFSEGRLRLCWAVLHGGVQSSDLRGDILVCDNSGQDHFRVGFLAFAVPPFTTDLQSLMQIICNEKFDGHSRKAPIRIISNIFSQLNYGA